MPSFCCAQADSTNPDGKVRATQRQLRLSFDISKPIINAFSETRNSYEAALDFSLGKEVYATVEGGFGSSEINYPDLAYTTENSFLKIGIDKTMVQRNAPADWDMLFVGLRYGIGFVQRNEASFTTADNFWATTAGTIPAAGFTAHWAELTGGVKVELLYRFFLGWTVRGKFLLNQGPFRELPPAFVAGYGRGERTTVFDFNFYASYVLRWNKRTPNQ